MVLDYGKLLSAAVWFLAPSMPLYLLNFYNFSLGLCIKCHQCSSSQEAKGQDNCGAYKPFDTTKSIPVDCNSDESVTPGTFCVKITQQGPRHFICKLKFNFSLEFSSTQYFLYWPGDARWRQVIRRCASVADTGVTGVCNWGVKENGVYWEECYCAQDGCNGSGHISVSLPTLLVATAILTFTKMFSTMWSNLM